MRLRQLAPLAVALGAWAAGTAAILRHVLLEDDFVSGEIRRHGVVPQLVATLAAFAVPYLALGAFSWWIARGLARLAGEPRSPLARFEGWIGAGVATLGLALAAVFTIVERPAVMAGYLWRRGGVLRSIQVAIERGLSPGTVAVFAVIATTALFAFAAAGWWRAAPRGGRRAALITLAATTAAILVVAVAPRRAVRSDKPNVLLVLVDSLRPDRALDPEVAPNIAALAARSVRFTDARTPCALTYPAVASLFTGKHPVRHGVRHHYPEAEARALGDATLPRALGSAGYETIAVGGYCSTPFRELDLGFQVQRTPRSEVDVIVSVVALRGHPWLPAVLRRPWARALLPQLRTAVEGGHPMDATREAVAAWRRARGPFFMAVFYDNAHLPYVPVWPDSKRAPGYAGPNRYTVLAGDLVEQVHEGETAATARSSAIERANALGLYDDAVRGVDRAIGRLLGTLDRDGLLTNTVVVLVADHGENLLDADGSLAHGEAIERDHSNSIPFLVSWPGRLAARDVTTPVLLTDVAPTLLGLLGLPPLPRADGVARVRELHGEPGAPEQAAILETGMWFSARAVALRLDPSGRGLDYPDFDRGLLDMEPGDPPHVIVAPAYREELVRAKHRRLELGPYALSYRPRTTGAAFALYRRDTDPWLTKDLAAEEPARFAEMVELFYDEARRLGETGVIAPESN